MSNLVFTMDGYKKKLRDSLSQTTFKLSRNKNLPYYNITFWTGAQWYLWPNDHYYTSVQRWFDKDEVVRGIYTSPLNIPVYKITKQSKYTTGFTKVSVVLPRVNDEGHVFLYIPKNKLDHEFFIFKDSCNELDYKLFDSVKLWYNQV